MKVAFTLTQCAHRVPGGSAVAALELQHSLLSQHPLSLTSVGARDLRFGIGRGIPDPSVHYPLPYAAVYELWNRSALGGVERLVPDADVVHVTLGFCPERSRIPQVCTVHDMFPFTHPETLTSRGAKVLRTGLERVIGRADLITTPSQASADELIAHGGNAERIRVVPWGATPETFADPDAASALAHLALPERFVLFAGTVEPRKNLDVLLAAMALTDESVNLVLVGPTGWGEIATRIPNLGTERIHLLGMQPRRVLLGLMTAASAVCMPSLAEGFGLPALEAMAQGTPVIHSDTPALREVVGAGGEAVAVDDVPGWAAAMSSFVLDRERSVELGRDAKKIAAPFTWERTGELMRSVYEELI